VTEFPPNYVKKAIQGEADKLAATTSCRNDQLFKCASNLASIGISERDIIHALKPAAERNGMIEEDGSKAFYSTIKSGLRAGQQTPRQPPHSASRSESRPRTTSPQHPPQAPGDFPLRTPPDHDGAPKFHPWGADGPPVFPDDAAGRRHVYHRGGRAQGDPVRIKIKKSAGRYINWYRVRSAEGVVGWQAQKPDGYMEVPYISDVDPFDPEVAGECVYWPEGERDVDTVVKLGRLALSFGGKGDLPDGCEALVAGRHIVILADNDGGGGMKHAEDKGRLCSGVAASVKIVLFPEKDVSDWAAAGHGVDKLDQLVARAAEWVLPARSESELVEKIGSPIIKSSKEFVAGFVPPEYAVVGLLQRRFFYSFTGQTGSGKTAITLVLSACAALGQPFAGKETKKTRVLYLAAENADDVRMRWIGLAQNMYFDIETIDVFFVEGRFTISKSLDLLRSESERQGGDFGLVIVDTGPTFFEGAEENDNKQLGDHARLLRSLITTIPGGPCVVANCHPIKNATTDQLLPRGGGAFLNETDGNLTCSKSDSTVELHWQGKFRGPDFGPMQFLIKTVSDPALKDSDGRLIPTVIAQHISDQAKEEIAAAAQADEDKMLACIDANPAATQATIATYMGWHLHNGDPNKMKVGRFLKSLIQAKLIKATRAGRWCLTDEGLKVLKGETDDKKPVTAKTRKMSAS
jgi:hypothetical protein